MEDGPGNSETGELFKGFVEEVAGVEVGSNENISSAGDGGMRCFLFGYGRVNGGVELEFAVNEEVGATG